MWIKRFKIAQPISIFLFPVSLKNPKSCDKYQKVLLAGFKAGASSRESILKRTGCIGLLWSFPNVGVGPGGLLWKATHSLAREWISAGVKVPISK